MTNTVTRPVQGGGPTTHRWLVRPHTVAAARGRLVCFPHAGIGASAYVRWAPDLPAGIELACVQPPGRESRFAEPSVDTLATYASAVATELEPLLDLPYVLFGHSLGALAAFETATRLRNRGLPEPRHLVVAASRAPGAPFPHPPLRHLDDLALALALNARYGGAVPAQVLQSEELRSIFLPPLRADLVVLETYVCDEAAQLSCAVTALAGTEDVAIRPADVAAWQDVTTGPFVLRRVEGGHFFVKAAGASLLAAVLASVDGACTDGRAVDRSDC